MISIQTRLLNLFLRVIHKKTLLERRFIHRKPDIFNQSEPTRKIYSSYNVDKYLIKDHSVYTLYPKERKSNKHILYLHGGAYVEGFLRPHWDFLHNLIKNTGCSITTPDYPLAPENTYKQTFSMVSEIYRELAGKVDQKNFILMGDSSGGGMALALAQLMKNNNVVQPDQIIMLSPWLDISLNNPEIKDIDPSDYFLGVDGLRMAGKAYAGDDDPDCYLLSPINGTLEGLGRMSLFAGSSEILVADARKLRAMAVEKGIVMNYYEYPGMFHAWMLLNLPESKKAREQIISLIQNG